MKVCPTLLIYVGVINIPMADWYLRISLTSYLGTKRKVTEGEIIKEAQKLSTLIFFSHEIWVM